MLWLSILAAVNLSIWSCFAYLVWRRRWTRASLAVACLHMLLVSPMSIAPLRAIAEPGTFHLGFGWVQASGAMAAVPALMLWSWGLSVATIALTRPTGRALSLIAIGDLALAANFGTFFTVAALQGMLREFKAQGGEFISLSGLGPAALMIVFSVVPFTFSALWALRHMRATKPPSAVGPPTTCPRTGDEASDDETCRLEAMANPFGPAVSPISSE